MAIKKVIKITNAATDKDEAGVFIRGSIDPLCLQYLDVDSYQRERLSKAHIKTIKEGIKAGVRAPDIDASCRDSNFRKTGDNEYTVDAPVYIIDGQQRVIAALELVEEGLSPKIGIMLHFGEGFEWESERFGVLNTTRRNAGANVLLRNEAIRSEGARRLYNFSLSESLSPIGGRVTWGETMAMKDVLKGTTLASIALLLNGGSTVKGKAGLVASFLTKAATVYKGDFEKNLSTFFSIVERAHGISTVKHEEKANQLRAKYLATLAHFFSSYENFWDGIQLKVSEVYIQRLSHFDLLDELTDALLAKGGGTRPVERIEEMLKEALDEKEGLKGRLIPKKRVSYEKMLEEMGTTHG